VNPHLTYGDAKPLCPRYGESRTRGDSRKVCSSQSSTGQFSRAPTGGAPRAAVTAVRTGHTPLTWIESTWLGVSQSLEVANACFANGLHLTTSSTERSSTKQPASYLECGMNFHSLVS